METLTIEVPKEEIKLLKEVLKKFNAKVVKKKFGKTPNALTIKTIEDAKNGIGIEGPIGNIDDFIDSL